MRDLHFCRPGIFFWETMGLYVQRRKGTSEFVLDWILHGFISLMEEVMMFLMFKPLENLKTSVCLEHVAI